MSLFQKEKEYLNETSIEQLLYVNTRPRARDTNLTGWQGLLMCAASGRVGGADLDGGGGDVSVVLCS